MNSSSPSAAFQWTQTEINEFHVTAVTVTYVTVKEACFSADQKTQMFPTLQARGFSTQHWTKQPIRSISEQEESPTAISLPFPPFQVFYFPLSPYQVFFFLISCQQSKQTQHNTIILLQIINLSVGLQRKKGQKLALIWFIYYDSKCESNCFHAKLSALCFAVDAMQQNNAEKLFPKIRSIYVPNSVTHAVSDFWDEFNSIHLKRLNWRAKTKCLFQSYNNDKDFI